LKKFFNLSQADLLYFLILLVLVVLTQFYSITDEVIDWDESTFMIMANDFYKGNLPYENLWDLKPPLFFIFLGSFYKIFGVSLLTTRLFGDLLIFLSSIVIYFISNKFLNKHLSLLSSTIYIFLVSFNFAQPTLTEFLATLFLLLAILLNYSTLNTNYFLIGFFLSLSIFTRTNMAIVVIYFLIKYIKKNVGFNKLLQFFLGGILPFLSLSLIYSFNGKLKEFIYSTFYMPFEYTFIRRSPIDVFLDSYVGIFFDNYLTIPTVVVILFFLFLLMLTINKSIYLNFLSLYKNYESLFNIFFLVTISIILTGRFYYHYLIQMFPFIAIFISIFINTLPRFKLQISCLLIVFFSILTIPNFNESIKNINNYEEISKNYPVKSFVKFINKEKTLLAIENHIIYFYLDVDPITPVVHPNVIMKIEQNNTLLTSLENLKYIRENEFEKLLNNFPDYIFCQNECESYFDSNYLNNYYLVHQLEDYKLYKINN